MAEKLVQFGPNGGLFGVLTEPESAHTEAPAVLLLNAGVLHHVGPFCWYVELARRLAGLGFPVLRFDLAGIGDSRLRTDELSDVEGALADIRAAAEHLARTRQVQQFVLIGLCSGALFAHHAAVRDPRVAGAVFLDGYGYRTPGFYLRHYLPRLLRGSTWTSLPGRLARRLIPSAASARHPRAPAFEQYFLDFPACAEVNADLHAMLNRGTRLLFLNSGGLATQYFNHARQFREMYGDLVDHPMVTAVYDERADHLYCGLDVRDAMFDRVETWMAQFAPANTGVRPVEQCSGSLAMIKE